MLTETVTALTMTEKIPIMFARNVATAAASADADTAEFACLFTVQLLFTFASIFTFVKIYKWQYKQYHHFQHR